MIKNPKAFVANPSEYPLVRPTGLRFKKEQVEKDRVKEAHASWKQLILDEYGTIVPKSVLKKIKNSSKIKLSK